MNTYAKGRAMEKWIEDYFLGIQYWKCSYRAPHVKFSKTHDIFNLFDGVAITRYGEVLFWQMKTNISDYYGAKKGIREWLVNGNEKIRCDLFWSDKKTIRIWHCNTEREDIMEEELIKGRTVEQGGRKAESAKPKETEVKA